MFGLEFELRLVLLILRRFFVVLLAHCFRQSGLRFQDRRLDALGLIIAPLIGRLDLTHHGFVGMHSGKQSGDRGEDSENRRAQGHPRNPRRTAMLRVVMDFLVQMLERNFGVFH